MALPSFFFFWKSKHKFISYLNINVDQSTKPLLQSGGESSNQTLPNNGLESWQYVELQIDNTNANPSKCFEFDQSRHVQVWRNSDHVNVASFLHFEWSLSKTNIIFCIIIVILYNQKEQDHNQQIIKHFIKNK